MHAVRYTHGMDGAALKQRRDELGMTQAELAAVFGVRRQTIQEWETGTRAIRLGRIVELALWAIQAGQVLALDHDDAGIDDGDS